MSQTWLMILMLSFAVSFDSYFFGLTYSVKSIKVTSLTYVVIGFVTGISFLGGYILGGGLAIFLPHISEYMGGIIFLILGLYILWQWMHETKESIRDYYAKQSQPFTFSLSNIWRVIKNPHYADVDHSGDISGKEALIVGLALSFDSFGGGIGSSLLTLPKEITALMIGASSVLFLAMGVYSGHWLKKCQWVHIVSFLPGIIFLLIGIWNFTK